MRDDESRIRQDSGPATIDPASIARPEAGNVETVEAICEAFGGEVVTDPLVLRGLRRRRVRGIDT